MLFRSEMLRDAADWMSASSLDISAGRKETPCHFIHSSPVNLSVLLNILRSFRNDRAHYTLCFRRSSLTYSALTYFALKYDISVSDLRRVV